MVYIGSSKSCEPKRFVRCWNKVERKQPKTATKLIPLKRPEHGFCQQNGPRRSQMQDWYPNEKLVVVPVCLNGRCFSQDVWVLYRIKRWRQWVSKEGRLFSSHLGIRNISLDVCCDDTKHYQMQSEKQGKWKVCKKNSRRHYVKCKST